MRQWPDPKNRIISPFWRSISYCKLWKLIYLYLVAQKESSEELKQKERRGKEREREAKMSKMERTCYEEILSHWKDQEHCFFQTGLATRILNCPVRNQLHCSLKFPYFLMNFYALQNNPTLLFKITSHNFPWN